MRYLGLEGDERMNAIHNDQERIYAICCKSDLESQIEFIELSSPQFPIMEHILESLKKLKSMLPVESVDIVKEMDTFDPTLGKCTGKCQIMGVGLTQCNECGWDETQSLV